MPSLSIIIPTYNRADKLIRLLRNIEVEMNDIKLGTEVKILVSDNASSDDTQKKMSNFNATKFELSYFRQDRNLGFDGNVRFLYDVANTDYVWFFSDDDILLSGSIPTVVNALKSLDPDVLLYSFQQPRGSAKKTFNYSSQFVTITEPSEIISTIARCSKLSMYVSRKIDLNKYQKIELEPFCENGFYWIDLCFTILAASERPNVCIISEQLASCDDEYNKIRFDPSIFLNSFTVYNHPFVSSNLPDFALKYQALAYYDTIQLLFAVKMGTLEAEDRELFGRFTKTLPFNIPFLYKNLRALLQLLALKLKIVALYKYYRRLFQWLKY